MKRRRHRRVTSDELRAKLGAPPKSSGTARDQPVRGRFPCRDQHRRDLAAGARPEAAANRHLHPNRRCLGGDPQRADRRHPLDAAADADHSRWLRGAGRLGAGGGGRGAAGGRGVNVTRESTRLSYEARARIADNLLVQRSRAGLSGSAGKGRDGGEGSDLPNRERAGPCDPRHLCPARRSPRGHAGRSPRWRPVGASRGRVRIPSRLQGRVRGEGPGVSHGWWTTPRTDQAMGRSQTIDRDRDTACKRHSTNPPLSNEAINETEYLRRLVEGNRRTHRPGASSLRPFQQTVGPAVLLRFPRSVPDNGPVPPHLHIAFASIDTTHP